MPTDLPQRPPVIAPTPEENSLIEDLTLSDDDDGAVSGDDDAVNDDDDAADDDGAADENNMFNDDDDDADDYEILGFARTFAFRSHQSILC